MSDYITPKQFFQSEGVEDWRLTSEGCCAFYPMRSFADAAQFVKALSELPGVEDHRPAVDIRAGGVMVRVITYTDDWFGPSQRDVEMARRVSRAARMLGLTADPSKIQGLLVIPGAPDITKVMPFWRAVLGYEPRKDSPAEDLVDPNDRGAPFWFETMKEPRKDGLGAVHIAVWLPREAADARIQAALAAGGRMVRDESAPSWWTLADAYGNEVDIATVSGRD